MEDLLGGGRLVKGVDLSDGAARTDHRSDDSKRVHRGGFITAEDLREALERQLARLRREEHVARTLTLAGLVETYLKSTTSSR
jgi:hypothetical protein